MKKIVKKIISLLLVVTCTVNMSVAVLAAETTTEPTTTDCRLTFSVTDKTNGIFIDEITITLMNRDTNLAYDYTVTSADYLFGLTAEGIAQHGTYNIAVNYASKERFSILNADGTAITSFTAEGEAHAFDWIVIDNGAEQTQSMQQNANKTKAKYVAETDNAEADLVWNTFLDSVSALEADSKYAAILKAYEDTKEINARYYAQTGEGRTEEEYLNMTPFERFLWYATYVTPVTATTSSDYNAYFGTIDKWNSNVIGSEYNLLKTQGAVEQAEAYKTLMVWQYNYFMANGAMYNFMTGKTSIEENNPETVSPESTNGNDTTLSGEETQSITDEESESAKEEQGIWDNTIGLIKDNVITIIVLLILAGATIGVVIYRKRKTINDDTTE